MTTASLLTDARTPGWFWMEDAVIDRYGPRIGAIGVALYAYLARRADKQGVCFPSYQTIAADLKLSRRTVITHIKHLQAHGLIVCEQRQGAGRSFASNTFRLVNLRAAAEGETVAPPAGPPPAASPSAPAAPGQVLHHPAAPGDPPGGETPAPGPEMHHQSSPETGAANALVQEVHQGGATDAPGMVQELHQGGAAVAPEGNTLKETQGKETEMKEEESDIAALFAALAAVTGKDLALLRPDKRREYEQAAPLLQARGFDAGDVRDFALFWREAHHIGSRKAGAGFPHLVQVLEDLTAAKVWAQARRQRQAEQAAWQEASDQRASRDLRPAPAADPQAESLWQGIRDRLHLRLISHPAQADLFRARPLRLHDGVLTVQMPSPRLAAIWQERLQRPWQDAIAQATSQPLTLAFTSP